MTESRDRLMVIYDFLCLFKSGRIKPNDINEILQDIENRYHLFTFIFLHFKFSCTFLSDTTDNNVNDSEREQKINLLERLKLYMTKQVSQRSDVCSRA